MLTRRSIGSTWCAVATLELLVLLCASCNPGVVGSPSPSTRMLQQTSVPTPSEPIASAPTDTSLLVWNGPLVVEAELPLTASGALGGALIYDMGLGRSAFLPFPGMDSDAVVQGWSADGCFLVVSPYDENQNYLVNIVTGVSKPLPVRALQLLYSPDGQWIAYSTHQPGADLRSGELSVVRVDNGNQERLFGPGWVWPDSWSSDSRQVFYWVQTEGSPGQGVEELYAVDIYSLETCMIARVPEPLSRWEDLYLADARSCQQVPLASTGTLENADEVWVLWPPTHRYVAIILEKSPGGDGDLSARLFILDTETTNLYSVHEDFFSLSKFLAWSPDGAVLAFAADFGEGEGVYLLEAETSSLRRLNVEPSYAPSWSPDGRMLALQSSTDKGAFVYNLETDSVTHLPVAFGDSWSPLMWSPRISYDSGACR